MFKPLSILLGISKAEIADFNLLAISGARVLCIYPSTRGEGGPPGVHTLLPAAPCAHRADRLMNSQ